MIEERQIDEVAGDGERARSPDELKGLLSQFKDAMKDITARATYMHVLRRSYEDTRFCIWPGQSDDGRKHERSLGVKPFPFEGATDGRIRIVDHAINLKTSLLITSAMRALVKARGVNSADEAEAQSVESLLRWLLTNQLGSAYRRELKKLCSYYLGDAPSAGVLGIFWKQETALEMKEVALADLFEFFTGQGEQLDPEEAQQIVDLFTNQLREKEAIESLVQIFPGMTRGRAKQSARDLRDNGVAQFPYPYMRVNLPEIRSFRVYEDIWFPIQTVSDLQSTEVMFTREWLTRPQLHARVPSEGYSEDFVEKVAGHGDKRGYEGQTGFPWYYNLGTGLNIDPLRLTRRIEHTNQYEIITAWYRATTDYGVPGIFRVPFHHAVEQPARDPELLDYKHGLYPFVYFQRELLNNSLLDSRSYAEVGMTAQTTLKLLHDAYNDRTQLETVPPLLKPDYLSDSELVIAPLAQNKVRRGIQDVGFLEFPARPVTNEVQQKEVLRQFNEYFGLTAADVPPEVVQLIQQDDTDQFLDYLRDALVQMWQLCQQYMPDEQAAKITGMPDFQFERSREAIQGKQDIMLTFDVRDLNMDYVLKKAEIIMKYVLPLDIGQTVQRDQLVAILFASIDPVMARTTLIPQQTADLREADDEQGNIAQIISGVEPPMIPEGQNHALRLQVLAQAPMKNPDLLKRLMENPDSLAMYQARVKHHQFQVQQDRNKIIGRIGAAPALQESAAQPATQGTG